MPPPGFEVDPEALDEGADDLDEVAEKVCGARETLSKDGDLPTLNPLATIAEYSIPFIGSAINEARADRDPYPDLRRAWEAALERYCKRVGDYAKRLRTTADEYRSRDTDSQGHIDAAGA